MVSQKVLWFHLTANKNYDEENELKRSKKVKIKGSEVGFSLMKIEKILNQKQQYAMKNAGEEKKYDRDSQSISYSFNTEKQNKEKQDYILDRPGETAFKEVLGAIGQLMNSEYEPDYINPELQRIPQKKKKKSVLGRWY